jgi:hypothetical protein
VDKRTRHASGSRFGAKGLGRKVGNRKPGRRFLIVCEGAVTEKEYIDTVKNELRYIPVDVEINAGNPNTAREIVEYAATKKKSATEKATKQGDESLAYDEVWCVFDGGEHPHETEARIKARDNDISLAISTPSAEIWILFHKVKQNAAITTGQALSLCKKHKLMGGKHILNAAQLSKEHYEDARTQSTALRNRNTRNGNANANPSSDFDLLIDAIRKAKEDWMGNQTVA